VHSEIEKLVITLLVMRSFSVLLGVPRACLDPSLIESNRKTISLVLGSGGARGLAHIGVIRALERQK